MGLQNASPLSVLNDNDILKLWWMNSAAVAVSLHWGLPGMRHWWPTCTPTLTSLLFASVMMTSRRPSVSNTRWLCEFCDTWGPYMSWNRDVISSHLVAQWNGNNVSLLVGRFLVSQQNRNNNHRVLSIGRLLLIKMFQPNYVTTWLPDYCLLHTNSIVFFFFP